MECFCGINHEGYPIGFCSKCSNGFHLRCLGLQNNDATLFNQDHSRRCPWCMDLVNLVQSRADLTSSQLSEIRLKYSNQDELNSVKLNATRIMRANLLHERESRLQQQLPVLGDISAVTNNRDSSSSSSSSDQDDDNHEINRILAWRLNKTTNTREFKIEWKILLDNGKYEVTWEPELNLELSFDILEEYCQSTGIDGPRFARRAGASQSFPVSINTNNWVVADQIFEAVDWYKNVPSYRTSIIELKLFKRKEQLVNQLNDCLFLDLYLNHCFVYAYLIKSNVCYIIDGLNLYMDDESYRTAIDKRLDDDRLELRKGIRFNKQIRFDHCGSAAASIILECRRIYKSCQDARKWPESLEIGGTKLYERFVRAFHRFPSSSFNGTPLEHSITKRKLPSCSKCGKTWRKIRKQSLVLHVKHCRGTS